ncbi:Helix-turn-helix domain-containing protein [Priestia aryabhattai B8W22]|uniref:helix-turn-helix domain-containing protein n=1 Tax=Priestia aryabhattai TaxID=412384 RepID=UPI00088AF5BC|nr:Helix-turn-helix domain-containing protein [Priestia aryabhattai B8W22]
MDSVLQMRGTIYEDGYGLIAQKVMRDKTLPKQSKLIYAYMCSFASVGANGDRVAFPSVNLQCNELGMTEDTYYKWRKPLEEKGYLTIEKTERKKGQFQRNLYYIEAVPVPKPVEPEPVEENILSDEQVQQIEESIPYPKNSGEVSPYPNSSCTENSCTENQGTNINNSNSNSLNINNNNENQTIPNPYSELNELNIPIIVSRKIKENMVRIGQDSIKLSDIEIHFNTCQKVSDTNSENTINQYEYADILDNLLQKASSPIRSIKALMNSWINTYIGFKQTDKLDQFYNWLDGEEEPSQVEFQPIEFRHTVSDNELPY